jgi:outer membrane lipoprotein-sorting protein
MGSEVRCRKRPNGSRHRIRSTLESMERTTDGQTQTGPPGGRAQRLMARRAPRVAAGSMMLAGVAVAGVLLGLRLGGSSNREDTPFAPFWLEAEITVESWSRTIGTPLPEVPYVTTSALTWLYRSNERYRYRVESQSDAEGDRETEVVADGSNLWIYDGISNVYQRESLIPGPAEYVPYPAMSVFLGPAPARSRDELLTTLNPGKQPESRIAVIGEETMLGRKVTVIEFSPASASSDGSGGERHEGTGRIWLDEDAMVILRYEIDSEVQGVSAVVTRFDSGVKHGKDAFRFKPPAGATERSDPDPGGGGRVTNNSGSGAAIAPGSASGSVDVPVAEGFLSAGGEPAGLRATAYEQNKQDGAITSRMITYATGAAGSSIQLFEQVRPGAYPGRRRRASRPLSAGGRHSSRPGVTMRP